MRLLRLVILSLLVVVGIAAPARALTLKDVAELSKAKVADEILLALIEADGSHFGISPEDVLALRSAGVSDRVITALIKTAARPVAPDAPMSAAVPAAAAPSDGSPNVVVIGQTREPTPVAVAVPIPVVVPYFIVLPVRRHSQLPLTQPSLPNGGFGRFINDGWVPTREPR